MTDSTLLGVVLLWVVCGGVAAWIADRKGRSVGAWFLCGFAFGPFGVIAAALARTGEQKAQAALAPVGLSKDGESPDVRREEWLGWVLLAVAVALGTAIVIAHR
jgi:MFS family permease